MDTLKTKHTNRTQQERLKLIEKLAYRKRIRERLMELLIKIEKRIPKIGLILILSILITAGYGYGDDQEYLRRLDEYRKRVTEILSGSTNEYKVIRKEREWHKLVLKRGNKTIYEVLAIICRHHVESRNGGVHTRATA